MERLQNVRAYKAHTNKDAVVKYMNSITRSNWMVIFLNDFFRNCKSIMKRSTQVNLLFFLHLVQSFFSHFILTTKLHFILLVSNMNIL